MGSFPQDTHHGMAEWKKKSNLLLKYRCCIRKEKGKRYFVPKNNVKIHSSEIRGSTYKNLRFALFSSSINLLVFLKSKLIIDNPKIISLEYNIQISYLFAYTTTMNDECPLKKTDKVFIFHKFGNFSDKRILCS